MKRYKGILYLQLLLQLMPLAASFQSTTTITETSVKRIQPSAIVLTATKNNNNNNSKEENNSNDNKSSSSDNKSPLSHIHDKILASTKKEDDKIVVDEKILQEKTSKGNDAGGHSKNKFASIFQNGGYDASQLSSQIKWSPLEAVEFVLWHDGSHLKQLGHQLAPLVEHWSGHQWGEFLTRLHLGERCDKTHKVKFESKNVLNPSWTQAMEAPQTALHELLSTCLPSSLLSDKIEMTHVAESFLWKEHTWPSQSSGSKGKHTKQVESFANLGYTSLLIHIWIELCLERGIPWQFSSETTDASTLLEMLPNVHQEWGATQLQGMMGYFHGLELSLTAKDKIEVVQGMARRGWKPAQIATFVSTFPEVTEEVGVVSEPPTSANLEQQQMMEEQLIMEMQDHEKPPAFFTIPPTTKNDATTQQEQQPQPMLQNSFSAGKAIAQAAAAANNNGASLPKGWKTTNRTEQ